MANLAYYEIRLHLNMFLVGRNKQRSQSQHSYSPYAFFNQPFSQTNVHIQTGSTYQVLIFFERSGVQWIPPITNCNCMRTIGQVKIKFHLDGILIISHLFSIHKSVISPMPRKRENIKHPQKE